MAMERVRQEKMQVLEINLISAQDLKAPSAKIRKLQTYALVWIDPATKLRTRTDRLGGENPTWNDKFLFKVSSKFTSGETSGVAIEVFASGYVKDHLIGTVRLLLSNCLPKPMTPSSAIGTPAFTAVQIRRRSGRFQGVLNIAAAVYNSSDFEILNRVSAVCFRDLMGENKDTSESTWRRNRRLSRSGSKRSQQSSGGESCDLELSSWELSDGDDSTSSSSSSSAASTALKEWNGVREMAGNIKSLKPDGGNLLCGLMLKKMNFGP